MLDAPQTTFSLGGLLMLQVYGRQMLHALLCRGEEQG